MSPSDDADGLLAAWRSHRPFVVNLGYQMLGDVGEAEDVAQEVFLRLSRADPASIDDVRGWLVVVAGRLCLDVLRSARIRRETPVRSDPDVISSDPTADPADRVTLDDQVSHALVEVLRTLSPGERVAFVLHDVFAVPFDDIARTVGRPVGTCRQLARRAQIKFTEARPAADPDSVDVQRVTQLFIAACASGDVEALAAALDPSVWGVGTVLGDPAPPPRLNRGPRDVATNLLRYLGPGVTVVGGPGGRPVLLAFDGDRLFAVLSLTIRNGLVARIEALADPAARRRD